jgi:hypothetical protein
MGVFAFGSVLVFDDKGLLIVRIRILIAPLVLLALLGRCRGMKLKICVIHCVVSSQSR